MTCVSHFSDFALYLEDSLIVKCDVTFGPIIKINVRHNDVHFTVQRFCYIS